MNDIPQAIEQLARHNRLSGPADIEAFENALNICAEGTADMTKSEVEALLKVFHDDTEHHEVMWGLVHLVEAIPMRTYIEALVAALPELERSAAHWAACLLGTITNDRKYADTLVALADTLDAERLNSLNRLLSGAEARRFPNAGVVRQRIAQAR